LVHQGNLDPVASLDYQVCQVLMELLVILDFKEKLAQKETRAQKDTLVPLDFPALEESKVTKVNAVNLESKVKREKEVPKASRVTWVRRVTEEQLDHPAMLELKDHKEPKEVKAQEVKLVQ